MLNRGEVVEALLYEEPDDPVGVKDEVSALSVLVADDSAGVLTPPTAHWWAKKGKYSREQRNELRRLREDGDGVKFHPGRDYRRGLLALGAIDRPNTLGECGLDVGHGECCCCCCRN